MVSFRDFVIETRFEDIPGAVRAVVNRSLLDAFGIAAIGSTTTLSHIVRAFARQQWCAGPEAPQARILFDGASVSPAGAAFAGAFTIDAVDGHDGHSPAKGHAGSAILPALLAFAEDRASQGRPLRGREFLAALAIGYEVAYRAGLALHATTTDYHTSGAWTAVGVAAMGARVLGLNGEQLRHAIGIAEYHGPRSQMMRCIDHPSMVRDGVGWGAPSGVSAAYLAALGFTGAPAITVEREDAASFWSGLGERWEVEMTHYKRYPVCRWAHPAMDAARDLMDAHGLASTEIERVRISTFHNATRLAGRKPRTMDELMYGIAFPTATIIVRGQVGVAELSPEVFSDPEIRRLSESTELVESDRYTELAVRERWADVTFFLKDGRTIQSKPHRPKGDPDDPLSDDELRAKYHRYAAPVIGADRARSLEDAVNDIAAPDAGLDRIEGVIYAKPRTAVAHASISRAE